MGYCATCKFYGQESPTGNPARQAGSDTHTPNRSRTGWCRRYAPRPLIGGSGQGWADYEWPSVAVNDWCGEYEPREGE